MKNRSVLLCAIAVLALAGCNGKPATETPQSQTNIPAAPTQMPPGHPAVGSGGVDPHAGMKAQIMPAGSGIIGKVTQVLGAPGKTFVQVADGKGNKIWLAMPEVKVVVGNTVEYPKTPLIPNFHSKSLNKDFENIGFIAAIRVIK